MGSGEARRGAAGGAATPPEAESQNCKRKTHKNGIYTNPFGKNTLPLTLTPKIQIPNLRLIHSPSGSDHAHVC